MLRKSAAALRSAKASLEVTSYDRAVSDLYYSAFQATVALMIIRKKRVRNIHTSGRL
ncbi:HEPN domain-containing protein [Paenibacillus mesophilus]|uniref:HEPN domain-containing protein n=1 Tax=Paenibacillus mesophilus TaxID=2582849 RepID=UPI003B75C8D3